MTKYFAYTDEAGNTGSNLFDQNQPTFITCTLLSKYNLDVVLKPFIDPILHDLNENELHANKMGLTKIEPYAKKFKELLSKFDIKPIFTVVDKLHVAKLKLFDTFFDSGLNPNVSNFHYGIRYMRLPLCSHIVSNISLEMAKRFWNIYKNHDENVFKEILIELKDNINRKKIDQRALELLNHSLNFAINNPLELLNHQRDTKDAPNIVAFGLLLNGLHDFTTKTKGIIKEFVHDEQNEFAKTMKELFNILKSFSVPQDKFSYIGQIIKQNNFLKPLIIKSSHSSYGLQLVDVCLWIYNRSNLLIFEGYPKSLELKKFIDSVSYIFNFTLDQLENDVMEILYDTATTPLSKNEISNAYSLIDEINTKIGI